jgi:integrase
VAFSARGTRDEPCDGQWGPSRYLDGVAIAWLTGARPVEIEKGVWVSYSAPEIRLYVRGVKGRVNREICWRADANSATQYLYKRLCDSDLKPIRLSVPSAVQLTHAIGDYGGAVFPSRLPARRRKAGDRAKREPPLTTLSYRHQLVSDMRRAGESELRIAALLGERQARTTYLYGRSRRGKLGGGLPVSISADTLAAGTRAESWRDRRLEVAADDDFDPEVRLGELTWEKS